MDIDWTKNLTPDEARAAIDALNANSGRWTFDTAPAQSNINASNLVQQ
jgi:hypothetical protein